MSRAAPVDEPASYAYSGVMRVAVGQYLEWLSVRQYAASMLESRKRHLLGFVGWCEERGVERFERVSRAILERYQKWLFTYRKANGKPLGVTTQYTRLSGIKAFLRWATRCQLLEVNPAADLTMPRLPDRMPREVLTVREVELVLQQPDVRDVYGLRDRAILEVLYSTGIRRGELCTLLMHDVDVERGTLLVREGKGRRDRMVPLGKRAMEWVDRYLAKSRPQLVVDPDPLLLFLSRFGEGLSLDSASALASGYIEAAQVGKKGSCHLFRHSVATAMLENGADIRFIQALLGHRGLDTTAMYTRVAIGKLKEIHTATHPAEAGHRAAAAEHQDRRAVEGAGLLKDLVAEDADENDDEADGAEG